MTTRVASHSTQRPAFTSSTVMALFAVTVAVAASGASLLTHPGWAAPQVLIGFAGYTSLGTAVAVMTLWRQQARRFGLPNHLTLLRAGLTCLMGGALFLCGGAAAAGWTLIALAVVALCLDGLDGWLARRLGLDSPFGARFDLEVDALLLLILALLVWETGRAGPWVLAIGLMRYVFVLAGLLLPALRRPLPESRRRKVVCAVQGGALIACLVPPLSSAWASVLAAAALLALIGSFAQDVGWLVRERRQAAAAAGADA